MNKEAQLYLHGVEKLAADRGISALQLIESAMYSDDPSLRAWGEKTAGILDAVRRSGDTVRGVVKENFRDWPRKEEWAPYFRDVLDGVSPEIRPYAKDVWQGFKNSLSGKDSPPFSY